MPIHCPLSIERLSTEQFRSLDYAVMGQMFASQNDTGRLADEPVYQSDVAQRLKSVQMPCDEEMPVELTHKTIISSIRRRKSARMAS